MVRVQDSIVFVLVCFALKIVSDKITDFAYVKHCTARQAEVIEAALDRAQRLAEYGRCVKNSGSRAISES